VRKRDGKRPLGKARDGWVDSIEINLKDKRWNAMCCIDLAEDRGQWMGFVKAVMNLRVASNIGQLLSS
jgi:hypothetical protein